VEGARQLQLLGVLPETLKGGLIVSALTHLNINSKDRLLASLDLAEQNQVQTLELSFDHVKIGRRLLEIRLLPLTLPAGRCMVQMIAQDVTERRQMEEALRESQARYRELFETSHDGIVIADSDGRLLDCNKAFIELLGYESVGQLRGLHFSDVTPEEYSDLDIQMKTLLNDENFQEYEKEYCRRSGGRVLVWVRIWNRRDAKGNIIGSWALIRDITTARRVESDISAIEKFRLLGELAAAISHEIRNPLTTVRGFLQLLSSRPTCSGEDQEFFQLMISEIDSATTIIKDFLDLARPVGPKRETISLSDLLTSLARIMESKAIMQRVEIKTQIEPGIKIIGDPSQLRQVYVNLLQNAFQAMPNGGILTITVGREEDTAVVRIGDTGVGIPADHLDRIGRPFFTTRPGGTGLGLTTCYRIVSSHVGKITVNSEVGVGTTFSVHLPFPSSA
jgi:two-component system sporulation sensor kinase A